jgi:hypothetical protein
MADDLPRVLALLVAARIAAGSPMDRRSPHLRKCG